MKKTILALTIPALFATSASAVEIYSAEDGSTVDLYGRVEYEAGSQGYQKAGSNATSEAENFGGKGEIRLGVNVKYMLNNDVDLIGKMEWQATAESSQDVKQDDSGDVSGNGLKSRYAWAGFRFMDTTDLTFGRTQDAFTQVADVTDIFSIFGGGASYGAGVFTDKVDDQVRLAYAANGLDLRASYAFNDADKLDDNAAKETNRMSVSAGYTAPFGLGMTAGYGQVDQDAPAIGNGNGADYWGVGLNYSLDGLYAGVQYTEQTKEFRGNADTEYTGIEAVVAYNVDAWTLKAGYNQLEKEDKELNTKNDTVDEYILGVQYAFNSKAKMYAEYVIADGEGYDDLNGNASSQDDRYAVGLQYNF